ncbi:unnamed protein product [Paramecium primaurelia]|uniref:Uncharacterized protein n=1 Tax=Paramecium primaurelia TaxID=5886 RepID=A0A8S1L6B8_PARPR|nr:unnamed protein product [Paramecium primaurelia]
MILQYFISIQSNSIYNQLNEIYKHQDCNQYLNLYIKQVKVDQLKESGSKIYLRPEMRLIEDAQVNKGYKQNLPQSELNIIYGKQQKIGRAIQIERIIQFIIKLEEMQCKRENHIQMRKEQKILILTKHIIQMKKSE